MDRQRLQQLANDRDAAEDILRKIFGHSHFYDEQWVAVSRLLKGERILMIERTGFGKSLCYQYPAVLLDHLTVVFSPLIALMRDQVKSLKALGIKARCINSGQSPDDNEQAIGEALHGDIKILYIAPERQENQTWIEAVRRMRLSMVVVDEAHTVSVWGHDFRPAFRRIINLVRLLPRDMPVLATTATVRVQHDIERQIGTGLTTIRGSLRRDNFRLHVIETQSEDEKMIWLAKHIGDLPGTGLIYTGTRVMTDNYSRWLQYMGINAMGYNAGLDDDTRRDIEDGLMHDKWKCVVSTNALGMGIDKPDIRFIIHTQIPASPIHYYQEIGRAGRDGKETYIVLFYNSVKDEHGIPEDYTLPKAFIDGARPSRETYLTVIDILKDELLGERDVVRRANLKQTQVRVILHDLVDQGIVKEVMLSKSKKYEYQYNAPQLNTESFDSLREAKYKDLEAMLGYVYTTEPRMKYLCDYLGDVYTGEYGGCDNTTESKWSADDDAYYKQKLDEFRETYFPTLKVEERKSNIINGVAASYYGISTVGTAIRRCKYEGGGDFPDFLLRLTLKAYRKTFGRKKIDLVMSVPPTISGSLVDHFAQKTASVLKVPYSAALIKTRQTQMQKIFHNAYAKRDNVEGAFELTEGTGIDGLTVLLIDDIYDSGATLRAIGRMLTAHGAKEIVPLVIAKTVGNDNI